MRSILIGMLVAVGLAFVGTAPTLAAPASSAVISQAAAEMSPVTPASALSEVTRWALAPCGQEVAGAEPPTVRPSRVASWAREWQHALSEHHTIIGQKRLGPNPTGSEAYSILMLPIYRPRSGLPPLFRLRFAFIS